MTTLIGETSAGWSKRARGSTRPAFSPSRALSDLWALQRDRWILWLPPAMVAGSADWMLAPADPPAWLGGAAFVLGLAGAVALAAIPHATPTGWQVRLRQALGGLCALLAAAGLGAVAAQARTQSVAQPPFEASDEPRAVEGWVIANDANDNGPRLRLLVRSIDGVDEPPRYARMSVSEAGLLTPGRAARCFGVLGPPSGPMAPGAYDFARRAYFERLGATGFSFGRCRPADFEPPASWFDRQRLHLAAMRADLSAEIQSLVPGRGGSIAAALISGDRSAVDRNTNELLFNAGLGHLLSVSGIHMSIVGGLVFATLLWTFSLISPIALRFPVKKIAAVGALMAVGAYLIVSGINVPALRSFIMAAVAFGAILLDRPAISMRGLALAAFIVILLFPESVLDASFQMSFAATMALVALFELLSRAPHAPALPTPGPIIGFMQWSTRAVGAVLLISVVAGVATDPFAMYHFQRFSLYSLPANLLEEPILSFLVAPAAVAAAVLAPFGFAETPLQVMSSGLDLIAAIGQTFGERPEAVQAVPKPPDAAFLLCVAALLCACLWRGALRWIGAPLLAASVAVYVAAPQPVAAFDSDLRAVYVRDGDHWTLLSNSQRSTYARDRLGATLGLSPAEIERLAPAETCSDTFCQWQTQSRVIFLARDAAALDRACVAGAIVIAQTKALSDYATRCQLAALITPENIAELGGAIITETPRGPRIARAWPEDIHRPWTPQAGNAEGE
ncbi:MAG: ComEC/Rec2 family competence protein [Alphaproteobacteria bacterium]|nr:ComEC/Rec2 family competence protein [Alphaproteobacteria bacterium]